MGRIIIEGGKRLSGEIDIGGAKNSVLPILAATVLCRGKSIIHNCPNLKDVQMTIEVLRTLGISVEKENDTLYVDSEVLSDCRIDEELMRQMRSSIIFLGAIIARMGKAVVSMPGGCEIGARPINLHLDALRRLGVETVENHGYIFCSCCKIRGARIHLDFPSVGATENIMLAAAIGDGTTIITNAAREPEILDLQDFLNKCGAKIEGGGSSVIRIDGVSALHGSEHTIIPDRIAAGTYLAAAVATCGEITVNNVCSGHMNAILHSFSDMGAEVSDYGSKITVSASERPLPLRNVRTMPYPGCPTDIQSPFLALAAIARGTSIITETIFENRFRCTEELNRMGANIKVDGRCAVVMGTKRLYGANVVADELRGGAALIIAGLNAKGMTVIDRSEYIYRGYENIEEKLSLCGAGIYKG